MTELIIPTVGSSGYYELSSPFDALVLPGERYTCQAVRRLSDYLANNETPKTDIYDKYGIKESLYDSDRETNMWIISLQSEKGHWLYVPARYVVAYPTVNGIPYRTVMIGAALPAFPADKDLSFLLTDIGNLISDSLGVVPVMKVVETSRVTLVPSEKHEIAAAKRAALSSGRVTDRSRFMALKGDYEAALAKIKQLEDYILAHQ